MFEYLVQRLTRVPQVIADNVCRRNILQGHDYLLDYKPTKLDLKCASCGHSTKGWFGLGPVQPSGWV